MTVREIRGHLEELYGIEVSRDLIPTITDAVLEAVAISRSLVQRAIGKPSRIICRQTLRTP